MDFDVYVIRQKNNSQEIREESSLLAYNLGKDILVALAVYNPTNAGIDQMDVENYWLNRKHIFGKKNLNHLILTNEIIKLLQNTNPSFSFIQAFISEKKFLTIGLIGNFQVVLWQNKKWHSLFDSQNEKKIQLTRNKIKCGDLLFVSHKSFHPDGQLLTKINEFVLLNQSSRIICEELINRIPAEPSAEETFLGIIQIK